MHYPATRLLSAMFALLLPFAAQAQMQEQPYYDPMAIPPGMQAVPVTPDSLPAGVVMQGQPVYAEPVAQERPQPVPASGVSPIPAGLAARQAASALPPASCPSMPIRISHGITYVTGGTVQPEIERLEALDSEFNLQILFAAKNGDHLINDAVRLLDYKNFELVAARAVGPYLYMYINPGEYTLEVVHEPGAAPRRMKITVPKGKRLRKTILLK